MKERPILMCAEMVRATLRDVDPKGQTRRALNPQPNGLLDHEPREVAEFYATGQGGTDGRAWFIARDAKQQPVCAFRVGKDSITGDIPCPYGQPGDRLWVKETFSAYGIFRDDGRVIYRADIDNGVQPNGLHWRPSIFMPRALSRITLEITDVRVQRLKSICHLDCIAEGLPEGNHRQRAYWDLWDSINGKGASDLNPFVWVINFRRVNGL